MRILIGTPIHQVKDYSMEKWLENVSQLEYPADLFLVDNSPGTNYAKKVKRYCAKYGVNPVRSMAYKSDIEPNVDIDLSMPPKHEYQTSNGARNYKIVHIELPPQQDVFERVARSREIIRQEILSHDYDAWFSWECDQIIPTNALDTLIRIMKAGDFMMVNHNCWARDNPGVVITDFGVSLIKRECLEKYSFILEFGTDPDMPDSWEPGEAWFKKRVLRGGGNCIEVEGVINPIYHLDK